MFTHIVDYGLEPHPHATAAEARACEASLAYDLEREARAEAETEARYERWLEDGGSHAEAIRASYELDAQMEAARGVVPFDEAMRDAAERQAVCAHHGTPLDANGCWECNAERDIQAAERAEDVARTEWKFAAGPGGSVDSQRVG